MSNRRRPQYVFRPDLTDPLQRQAWDLLQQVVVVVDRLVALDRLPPGAANKKTPAERKHVLAGVGFVAPVVDNTGWEGAISRFHSIIAVVDTKDHVLPHFHSF